jgi:hypothetical protein
MTKMVMDEFHTSYLARTRNYTCAICRITGSAYLVVDLSIAGRMLLKRIISKEDVMS